MSHWSVRKLAGSLRRHGVRFTVRKSFTVLVEALFDLRHGTDTGGRIPPGELDVSGAAVADAAEYAPTRWHLIHTLLRRLDPPTASVFVDYGSGKGRVLLAASHYPFRRIVGVEYSEQLCAIARDNVAKYCTGEDGRIEVLAADAAGHTLRDDETVFFLFNPFHGTVMQTVLDNISRSLQRRPRRVWLVYNNPRCAEMIEARGDFTRSQHVHLPYHDAVVYTNVPAHGVSGRSDAQPASVS